MNGLMGLFDDPLTQLSIGLLSGQSPHFGPNLAQAVQFAQMQRGISDRRKEEAQQAEMRALAMEQQKRAMEMQKRKDSLTSRFFDSPQEGPPMMDPQGYAGALMGIDPQASLAMQAQLAQLNAKERPKYHVVDGALIPEPSDPSQQSRPVYQAPPKEDRIKVGTVREIKSGGNIHTYEWDGREWKKIASAPQFKPDGPEKPPAAPAGYRWTASNNLEPIPGGPAENKNQASEAELTAAGYGGRMMAAEKIVNQVGAKGEPTVGTVMASTLPLGPSGQRFAERQVMSDEQQKYRQAQEDWVRAKLRKESGAVIAEDEMKREIETYFPQYGDSQAVIQQKAQARATAIRAMQTAAGKARGQVDTVSGGWSIKAIP